MPSHFYVSGPAHVAVGLGASRGMLFLGDTRDGVHIREDVLTRPVMADYAGPSMPADFLVVGKQVTATMRIVRFDPATMLLLHGRFFGGAAGVIQPNEIGTLLLNEGYTFPVMVTAPYAAAANHPLYASNLAGFRLLNAFLDQGHGFTFATVEQEHDLTFTSITFMNPNTLAGTCWDTNTTGFPQVT